MLRKLGWSAVFVGTAGVLFPLIAVFNTPSTFSAKGRAEGVVLSYDSKKKFDSVVFFPVVEFTVGDERRITFSDKYGSAKKHYKVGQRVRVVYVQGDPYDAWIDYGLPLPGVLFFGVLLGLSICAAGAATVFIASRRKGQSVTTHTE